MPVIPQFEQRSSALTGGVRSPQIRNQGIGGAVAGIGEGLDYLAKKADEDARIWAQKSVTNLRTTYTQKLSDAQNSGEDLNGFTPRIAGDQNAGEAGELDKDFESLKKTAPNSTAQRYLDQALPAFREDIFGAALKIETTYRVNKRVADIGEIIDQSRNQLFTNPSSFPKIYAENKHLIDGLDLPIEIKSRLQEQLKGLGASAVQGMIENGNPYAAASQLKAGAWNNYIDPDRLGALTNMAQSEVKRREAEAKANAAMARAEASNDAQDLMRSDLISRQLGGKPLGLEDQSRIKAGLTPKQWEKYQSLAAKADTVFQATGDLRTLPQSEVLSAVEKLKPTYGTVEAADQQAAYEQAQTIAAATLKRRASDPGLEVRDSFPPVQAAWQAYEAAPSPEGLRAALKASESAQIALGIPPSQRKLMPEALARNIAGRIADADPQKAGQELKATADQFGPFWNWAFRQISPKLDPALRVAATVDDDAARTRLINASRKPISDLKRVAGVTDNDIAESIAQDHRFQSFVQAVGGYDAGVGASTDVARAAEIQALGYMTTNRMDKGAAANKAIEDLLGKYQFARVNGRSFVAPQDVDVDLVENQASALLRNIDASKFDLPAAPRRTVATETRAQFQSSLRRNGYWATSPGLKGLMLFGPTGNAVTQNNQPVVMTWDEIAKVAPTLGDLPTRSPDLRETTR